MSEQKKILVPNIGDFKNVEVIEVLVKSEQEINKNDPLITLESDKSSVEVPSPISGKISSLEVKIGDKVSKGSVLAIIEDDKSETSVKIKKIKYTKVIKQKKEKPLVLKDDEIRKFSVSHAIKNNPSDKLFLEFGVFKGDSINIFAKYLSILL